MSDGRFSSISKNSRWQPILMGHDAAEKSILPIEPSGFLIFTFDLLPESSSETRCMMRLRPVSGNVMWKFSPKIHVFAWTSTSSSPRSFTVRRCVGLKTMLFSTSSATIRSAISVEAEMMFPSWSSEGGLRTRPVDSSVD